MRKISDNEKIIREKSGRTELDIVLSPEGREREEIIRAIARDGLPADARIIYEGSRNRLGVVDGDINVKAFGRPRFPNNFVYGGIRKSKARRSYEHALRLRELGFTTPLPYGYAEEFFSPMPGVRILRRSYYFCRQVAQPNMRLWESNGQLEQLLDQWGAEIARLHRAGVWMKDHSAGNVLLDKDADGNFTFAYVDLNRIRFGVSDERKLMQMFRSVSTSGHFTCLLARSYARAMGKDEARVSRMARKIFRRFNHIK